MNPNARQALAFAAALFASAPVFAQSSEAPVRVKVDGLPSHVATQVQSKAGEGPTSLRRFIERTRAVYELNYGSVAVGDAPAAFATKPVASKVAAR